MRYRSPRTRLEAVATARTAAASRVVRGAVRPGEEATGEPPATERAPKTPIGAPAPREVTALPGTYDINRLTDQVVAAIDRRIVAHRERMGRI